MAKDYLDITRDISSGLKGLRGTLPKPFQAFSGLAQASLEDGALDKKTKELIALAIGVAVKCDGCIGFHAKALVELGATEAEVAETLAMTVYLGGGPSLMFAGDAWNAFQQFRAAANPA
jgi:AhpD family alkylhydroperoxidase